MSASNFAAMKKSLMLLSLLAALSMQNVVAEESLPQRIGASVKKGGEAAGRGIKKGGEAAAKGVKKGGEATVKGVKKAGDWVGKKMQQGGEKLEKASK
jgi:hypothetical protein